MPGGRPTKYDPKFCDDIIPHFEQGMSTDEVADALGFCTKTFYNWMEKHEEFLHAVESGQLKAMVWWKANGRVNLENTKFNTKLWDINMKNRYGWADRTNNTTQQKVIITEEEKKDIKDTVKSNIYTL